MKIKPIYNKKIMSKEFNPKDLKKIIREALAKKPDILKEFDKEEDLDIDLNPDAEAAAKADWTPETTQAEKDLAARLAAQFGLGTGPTIKTHEKKFGAGSINEAPLRNTFDTTSLSKFLKDAMFSFMEGDGSMLNYAEAAHFLEQELIKNFDIHKKMRIPVSLNQEGNNPNVNPDSKINRPKDSEGQPITLKARVEDVDTGTVGHVIRFGVDDNGNQTVHVDWMYTFGDAIVKPITYPNKIVVKDDTRIVREEEENKEAYSESRYMFFSNLQQIQRQSGLMLDMNEEEVNGILENGHDWAQDHIATAKESMDQVFDFLMNETKKESEADLQETEEVKVEHALEKRFAKLQEAINYLIFKQDIGQLSKGEETRLYNLNRELESITSDAGIVFDFEFAEQYIKALEKARKNPDYLSWSKNQEADFNAGFNGDLEESSIRSHANGRGQNKKPGNFPRNLKRVGMNENFDYAGEERAFHNQPEIDAINKSESEVENNIPEELRKFYVSGSFEIAGPDSDGTKITQYALRIPKQSDETLKDIEKFVKEEIGVEIPLAQDTEFGTSYKQIGTYTELEKATNNWIIKVSIREGKNI